MPAQHIFKKNHVSILLFLALLMLLLSPVLVTAENPTQTQLEQELIDIEKQIALYEAELSKTSKEKQTLMNKIQQLKTQQAKLNLQIKQTSLKIDDLNGQLTKTQLDIKQNLKKEDRLKIEIADLLRKMNQSDDITIMSLLSADSFSGAFGEVQNYMKISESLKNIIKLTQALQKQLADQKELYEDQKSEAENLIKIKSIQQKQLGSSLNEQDALFKETKGLESNYKVILSDTKKRAAEIRGRIYELFNTGKQITFGQAVDMAKMVSQLTGIRPAFLLAILTQESNLGKNVGTCNRLGDPPEKSWTVIMKPTRDQEPFKKITSELGLNIDTTPVSCPMRDKNGNQVGWGGAMGPAQFIPSTWMGYKDKVSVLTGKKPANPWDIRDAAIASAVKLKADGANGTEDGEWKAALRYFSGSVNLKFRFYADNVMALAKKYQEDIDAL